MTDKQLLFNLLVSASLALLGTWVAAHAAVGTSLIALAATLALLSLAHRFALHRRVAARLRPALRTVSSPDPAASSWQDR